MESRDFLPKISIFGGRSSPEEGYLVGYGSIINIFKLPVPLPKRLALISMKKRKYNTGEWLVLSTSYKPENTLYKQLVFALKYEGVNLLVLKKLFENITESELEEIINLEPLGQYSRKIWFLYEWLGDKQLNIPNLNRGNPVPLVDPNLQYTIKGKSSARHRIINNLPGTKGYCPLIFKTEKLAQYISANLSDKKQDFLKTIHKDVLQRASAYLLLKDSKASFSIEGENPGNKRAMRWGKAIGQAGSQPINKEELLRLQQIVIESSRFIKMGFRTEGGFIGDRDRNTMEPIPDHISARHQDIEPLIDSLIATNKLLEGTDFNAVLTAAEIAFGFVFIHPFVDGNGRLHRYIIHQILAKMNFAQQGVIFPVSASILDHIDDYRKVLQSYSQPLLDFIDWQSTEDRNVAVLNDTIDYYRYFDATPQAEFLFDCVEDTIENIIPNEIEYLNRYDDFKRFLDNKYEMPDNMVALLVRFLEQNNGKLSKRARTKEFEALADGEVEEIEHKFDEIFANEA